MTIPLDQMTRQDMEDELKLRELLRHRQTDEARRQARQTGDRFVEGFDRWWWQTKLIAAILFALTIYFIWSQL